ncbi:hypothetical protein [Psychroserpens damuponensis]|uniref:hypothetical protein n=1 Tax=Psychroserpens damuponensis TaxID=943936 RepID=UPI00058BBA4A|nr:hypothetical protein [Psychroserpens damuponensis]
MSKTIHRIIQLLSALDLSARQFDISIGSANGYTLRMQKNNASVGSDVIERIVKKYPQINLVWLITGQGEMFLKDMPKPKVRTKAEIEAYIDDKLKQQWSDEKRALLDEVLMEIEKANKAI